jgi:hypothetical protein
MQLISGGARPPEAAAHFDISTKDAGVPSSRVFR